MTRAGVRSCVLATLSITLLSASGDEGWRFALPDVVMSDGNTARAQAGLPVVEVLPARDREVAVLGVVKVGIDSDRLLSWVRQVEELHRSPYVPVAHRFSDPPTLDDVRDLALDDQDLDDLRECRPERCGLKLSSGEITEIRRAISDAGREWRKAAQVAFRRTMVDRARMYFAAGHASVAPYHDHKSPVLPGEEFDVLSRNMKLEKTAPTGMASYLRSYPGVKEPKAESFLYWSKETLGGAKPIVAITHVSVFASPPPSGEETFATHRGADTVTVAFKQVYATHYLTASLSLMWLTPAIDHSPRYLVYVRRSRADVLGGVFAGVLRRLIEHRIRSEAPPVLDSLRRRLETEPVRDTSSEALTPGVQVSSQ
jgi:hypothetical protein